MTRLISLFICMLPLGCLAQFTIAGKVVNKADKKPVENVSVFLSNATTGDKTAADGTFTLRNVKPGKYDLVVTDIAFETYSQTVIIENTNISLPDILLSEQTRSLKEVTIKYHADPDRERYYNMFKDAFLGNSNRAAECKIINPEVLDLNFEAASNTLKASSYDFLIIENDALGYRIKYLLTDFLMRDSLQKQELRYRGFALFEELKGSPSQQAEWQRARQAIYANSPMRFLRSVLSNHLDEDGFRVQKLAFYPNPERPPDSLINAKIRFYKNAGGSDSRDSLAYWVKKSKLQSGVLKLLPVPLHKRDLISQGIRPNQYFLSCDDCDLIVAYNKAHRFHINDQVEYLYNAANTDNTFIRFNTPDVTFYSTGVVADPYNVTYRGVWGRYRAAELLPIDYEPPQGVDMPAGSRSGEILAKLDSFSSIHIAEKAYLQFDKPYYATGDTIYFKAYVTAGSRHRLSGLSGVLHAELINTKNKIDQHIKLKLTDGVAWGDFALPDSLPKGNYRVRAWTQWMRNDSNYFEKVVPIGSLKIAKVTESAVPQGVGNAKPDVQFFPEGGSLVAGIKSKVAFKATGPNGLGMDVKGEILDYDNTLIISFASVHLGMGSFEFVPQTGKTYHAKLTYTDGSPYIINLPKVEDKGIVLSVNNDSIPVAKVRIEASKSFFAENKNKNYTLLIYSGGTATMVPCELDSTVITFDILKRKLFTGPTRITLFSPNNEPLCERLIFVQNYDQLNLNAATDKDSYKPHEKVIIKLNAKTRADSAAMGHFSVSVTDESKVPVDENAETTILTSMLLTSELKGHIEQPNYYFSNITDTTAKSLDLVMLTHGYRKFTWKQVLNDSLHAPSWQPETGLAISGTAKSLSGKPLNHSPVSLISTLGGPLLTQTTDEKGNFRFTGLNFTDTVHYVLQAVTADGKNSTQLVYNKNPNEPTVVKQPEQNATPDISKYLQNHKAQWDNYAKYGLPGGRMLKEVKIKAVKDDTHYRSSSPLGPGHADQVMHADEIEEIRGPLTTSLNGRLRGVRFVRDTIDPDYTARLTMFSTGPMLVVIDGNPVRPRDINTLISGQVETVEVLRFTSTSIYGMQGANGVLIITTKLGQGLQTKDITSIGILPITVQGFYKAREFYSPKYDVPPAHPDLRSTIYWQPEITTDKDGNASFNFYNADGTGHYRVVVEGIDEKGNIGRRVYRYTVE